MEDQQLTWCLEPELARVWARDWANEAKSGSHAPVKHIRAAAENYKARFCTNGLWSPGAAKAYNILRDYQDVAQENYEDAQPPIEN